MTVLERLEALRDSVPRSEWDAAMKALKRQRLENYKRDKRQHLSPSKQRILYARQGGRCNECKEPFPLERLEWDHVDPNRQDFNTFPSNWQGLCHGCHKEKGSMSIMEQAKHYGRPVTEILQ